MVFRQHRLVKYYHDIIYIITLHRESRIMKLSISNIYSDDLSLILFVIKPVYVRDKIVVKFHECPPCYIIIKMRVSCFTCTRARTHICFRFCSGFKGETSFKIRNVRYFQSGTFVTISGRYLWHYRKLIRNYQYVFLNLVS